MTKDIIEEVKSLHYGLDLLEKRVRDLESKIDTGSETAVEPPPKKPADEEITNLRLELEGARKVTANQKRVADTRTDERDEWQGIATELRAALITIRDAPGAEEFQISVDKCDYDLCGYIAGVLIDSFGDW